MDDSVPRVLAVVHNNVIAFLGRVFCARYDSVLGIDGGVFAETIGGLGTVLGLDADGVSSLVYVSNCSFGDFQRILAKVLDAYRSLIRAFADITDDDMRSF